MNKIERIKCVKAMEKVIAEVIESPAVPDGEPVPGLQIVKEPIRDRRRSGGAAERVLPSLPW